ncbi:PREDICTED: RING-H2 finger protein ATL13-like [Ipomoea nil]|uniref:RING-H2 finger protein ATL13-like n=1 Tax=Ipomoea nil TaxID=35883 RepID=UPI00090200D5|nr:PREDICTED: RING-H2 finger protein ATL13-like [Ipomoea nil]
MDEKSFLSPFHQPIFLPQPLPPPPPRSGGGGFSLNNKVSPSILLIIIILAIIFFISGLLHLLVRYLLRPSSRDPDEVDNLTALQGQLQQLFHLHDAGVDQSFIDTLPIFNYKAIIGVKNQNHFDCAVCLCEFEGEDKLRLLPKCSHAFHMECIDTWLLSHSTCPLCRGSLLPDYSMANSPIVLVLESGGESSREMGEGGLGNSHSFDDDDLQKSCEMILQEKGEGEGEGGNQEKVVKVKLGKFRNVDSCGEGSSIGNGNDSEIDSRRCFSMGSFAYIMDEKSSLHVPIRMKKQSSKKKPLTPGHRVALSECGGCDSRRDFNGFEAFRFSEIQTSATSSNGNEMINKVVKEGKRESFSVSKIWLRGNKDNNRPNSAAAAQERRAVSFRFPAHSAVAGTKTKSGGGGDSSVSEITPPFQFPAHSAAEGGTRTKGSGGGGGSGGASVCEIGIDGCCDGENDGSHIVNSSPSFGRRTLSWLMGRQNKVVHSTFSSNV